MTRSKVWTKLIVWIGVAATVIGICSTLIPPVIAAANKHIEKQIDLRVGYDLRLIATMLEAHVGQAAVDSAKKKIENFNFITKDIK